MSAQFNAESMYTYLKGYAMGRKLTDTIKALAFARELHKDQLRKDGQPYIVHPLTMACHAITIGLDNDVIIAACLLHDVVEDCGMTVEELPVSMETKRTVMKLTHLKPTPLSVYYQGIMSHNYASIVKLLDRCNNVSTMAGVFTGPRSVTTSRRPGSMFCLLSGLRKTTARSCPTLCSSSSITSFPSLMGSKRLLTHSEW